MKKLHEIFDAELLAKVLKVIGVVFGVFVIFTAGLITGTHKSNFGKNWGDNYHENFGVGFKKGDMMAGGKMMGYYPNAHGATGEIIKLELPNIIVLDNDNLEKVIIMNEDTDIERMRSDVKSTDLKIGDYIVTIGSPNTKGQIEAKLIRIMPTPPPVPKIQKN